MASNNENVAIRSMDQGDINDIIRIHTVALKDSRSTNLGKPFLRKMYRWYLTYQPKLAFVATIDEQLVGFVTGSVGGSSRKIFRFALWEVLMGFLYRPNLLLQAEMFEYWQSFLIGLLPRRRKKDTKPTNAHCTSVKASLNSIAVSPLARRKNVGKSLVNAFEYAARLQGATILGLGVDLDNLAARCFYERCGWELARINMETKAANYIKKI